MATDVQVFGAVRKVNCQGVVYDGTGYKHRDAGQKPNSRFVEAMCELCIYSFSRITPYIYFTLASQPVIFLVISFEIICPELKYGEFPPHMPFVKKLGCNICANVFMFVQKTVVMCIFYPLIPFLILYSLKPSRKAGRVLCMMYLWFVYISHCAASSSDNPLDSDGSMFVFANYVVLYLVFMLKSPRHKIIVLMFTVFPYGIMVMNDPSILPTPSPDEPQIRYDHEFKLLFNDSRPVLGLITNNKNLPPHIKRRFKIMEPNKVNHTVVESVKKRFEEEIKRLASTTSRTRSDSTHVGKLNITEVTASEKPRVTKLNVTEIFTTVSDTGSTTERYKNPPSTTAMSVITSDVNNPYRFKDGVVIQSNEPEERVKVMDENYKRPARKRVSYRSHPRQW